MTAGLTQSRRHEQLARLRAAMDAPSGRVAIVNVPMGNFLMIDGSGSASDEAFRSAIRAVADLSAALRLYLQEDGGALLDPMPLELLWAVPGDEVWQQALLDERSWTAMVAQPSAVSPEMVSAIRDRLEPAHGRDLLCRIRLGSLREGLSAQTAYAGRTDRTAGVLQQLLEHIRSRGYEPHGPHHEIFVADLRHRDVASLRTVVRQPIHHAASR